MVSATTRRVDAEVDEDLEVLLGLRHPPIVGGDDEQGEVDRADAGDHVLDEVLVARDVDDPDRDDVTPSAVRVEVGEAEVDRDAARPSLPAGGRGRCRSGR